MHAGVHLCAEMRHDDVGEHPKEPIEDGRLAVEQRLRAGEGAARPALDQIARERERSSRESDQRHLELLHQEPDGLRHVRLVRLGLQRPEPLESRRIPERRVDHRPSSGLDPDRHADRVEGHHDVGEQDRRVERHPAERLERELHDLVRAPARLQDVRVPAPFPVLGKRATRLAHEPDRRAVDGAASERAEQTIVGKEPGHALRIRSWMARAV